MIDYKRQQIEHIRANCNKCEYSSEMPEWIEFLLQEVETQRLQIAQHQELAARIAEYAECPTAYIKTQLRRIEYTRFENSETTPLSDVHEDDKWIVLPPFYPGGFYRIQWKQATKEGDYFYLFCGTDEREPYVIARHYNRRGMGPGDFNGCPQEFENIGAATVVESVKKERAEVL